MVRETAVAPELVAWFAERAVRTAAVEPLRELLIVRLALVALPEEAGLADEPLRKACPRETPEERPAPPMAPKLLFRMPGRAAMLAPP